MSWFNFWSKKATDNILDKDNGLIAQVGSWIGGQQYTDEEKAEDNKDLRKGVIAYAVATLGENSERSKARREIARMWIKTQLGLVLMCAICAPFNLELSGRHRPQYPIEGRSVLGFRKKIS